MRLQERALATTMNLRQKGHGTRLSLPLFLKNVLDKYTISASSLEKYYYVDGHQLERQYKEHLSDYLDWKDKGQGEHADKWLVFPHNVGPRMSIDETSLSDGELYTIVSNKDAKGKRGALAAIDAVCVHC